jgi:hypothetical protein
MDSTTVYVYSRISGGAWAATGSFSCTASYCMAAAPAGASSIVVFWSDGTYLDYSVGYNATWAAKVDTTIVAASAIRCLLPTNDDEDHVYVVTQGASSNYDYYHSIYPIHSEESNSLKCVATSDKCTTEVFDRTTSVSSPISLPENGRFPDMGPSNFVDVEVIGYGSTKITSSDMEFGYTED